MSRGKWVEQDKGRVGGVGKREVGGADEGRGGGVGKREVGGAR